MSKFKVFQIQIDLEHDGHLLKDAVFQFLTEIRHIEVSKREVKKWIENSQVHLNTGPMRRSSIPLKNGDKILVKVPIQFLKAKDEGLNISFNLGLEDIVFEDKYLIVVNKPSGLSSQASLDPKRDHLYAAVKRYLQKSSKSEIYCALMHRLDVDTSGLILFTKKKSINKEITEMFSERKIVKKYLALVEKDGNVHLEQEWEIKNHLARKEGSIDKKRMLIASTHSGGDFAHTKFKLIKDAGNFALIECQPKTGRTHQIRVHLFEQGLRIIGDPFYVKPQSKPDQEGRLLLHAHKLEFNHPIDQNKLELVAKMPLEFEEKMSQLEKS